MTSATRSNVKHDLRNLTTEEAESHGTVVGGALLHHGAADDCVSRCGSRVATSIGYRPRTHFSPPLSSASPASIDERLGAAVGPDSTGRPSADGDSAAQPRDRNDRHSNRGEDCAGDENDDENDDDDDDDEGVGLNGIGFRPTAATAWRRAAQRREQVARWRAREAVEARQSRAVRRKGGVADDESTMRGRSERRDDVLQVVEDEGVRRRRDQAAATQGGHGSDEQTFGKRRVVRFS